MNLIVERKDEKVNKKINGSLMAMPSGKAVEIIMTE